MKPLGLIATFFLALSIPALGADAATFRGDLIHSGAYDAAGVPKVAQLKWKFATKGMVISSPAVAKGVVYVGSTDGNLYAVDLETGAQKWKFETKVRITASPTVDGGIVYFGSYDGKFYALDAANGQLKWKFQTGGERRFAGKHLHGSQPDGETMPDPFDFYLSSPAVAGWCGLLREWRWECLCSGCGVRQAALEISHGRRGARFSGHRRRDFVHRKLGQLFLLHWMPGLERKNGVSKLVKTTRFITRSAFNPRQR
jgi:PQQ-like domain